MFFLVVVVEEEMNTNLLYTLSISSEGWRFLHSHPHTGRRPCMYIEHDVQGEKTASELY